MSGSCSSCNNVDPAFLGVAEEGFNRTDLGQETPGDSKLGPEPLLHLHQRTGKAGWLLCSPASSVLLLFFPYPFSLFLFSGQKQFGPFFLSNFFFFLILFSLPTLQRFFSHAGWDVTRFRDLSFPVAPGSVGENYSTCKNILRNILKTSQVITRGFNVNFFQSN